MKCKNIFRLFALMGAAMIVGIPLQAQETPATAKSPTWYMGIDDGLPFGYSTFRSFGADKTRPGFDAGVFGGYRFSPLLSLEVSARMGKLGMSATDCCILSGYWLGQDGRHYHVPALGLEGWNYGDLKSDVRMQEYALQLAGLVEQDQEQPVGGGSIATPRRKPHADGHQNHRRQRASHQGRQPLAPCRRRTAASVANHRQALSGRSIYGHDLPHRKGHRQYAATHTPQQLCMGQRSAHRLPAWQADEESQSCRIHRKFCLCTDSGRKNGRNNNTAACTRATCRYSCCS